MIVYVLMKLGVPFKGEKEGRLMFNFERRLIFEDEKNGNTLDGVGSSLLSILILFCQIYW